MSLRTMLYLKVIKRTFNKRFFLARLTKLPLLGRAMNYAFFEDDEMIILPKESVVEKRGVESMVIEVNAFVEPASTVLPSKVVEHFVRKSRYHFLMNECTCRASNGCKDYPRDLGCIFLGKGVLGIDARLGRLVTEEEALAHLRRCREAGLVHLIGRNKIDSVVFSNRRKEDLLSICSCCPCCCLWKMIPDLSLEISSTVTKMPGVEITVDEDVCNGCGACVKEEICFVDALHLEEGRMRIREERCKGCARCVEFCPNEAIRLSIRDPSFLDSSVKRLEPLVDVDAE